MLLDTSGHHQSNAKVNDLGSGRPLVLVCLGLFFAGGIQLPQNKLVMNTFVPGG